MSDEEIGLRLMAESIERGFATLDLQSGKVPEMIQMGVKRQDAADIRAVLAELQQARSTAAKGRA
jgi:hypothetical protein